MALVVTGEEIIMAITRILKFDDIPARHMPNGATIRPLVDKESCDARIKTNTVTFPPGHAVEFHRHDCNEMIVVLEGDCAVETEDLPQTRLKQFDTVSVEAGTWHRFLSLGTTPFTLLAIYDAERVERTLRDSGKTTVD
jgi:quercetin dioxygenase-like cupin family protein